MVIDYDSEIISETEPLVQVKDDLVPLFAIISTISTTRSVSRNN